MNLMAITGKPRAVQRVKKRSIDITRVYNTYFDQIYSYIRYNMPDDASADDLTAQVFERCLKSISRYDPAQGELAGWLFGIARNTLRESRRQRRTLPLEHAEYIPADSSLPEESLLRLERTNHILDAVIQLDQRERDLIALKFGAGLNNRQIAGITGLSESNVGTIIYRALKQLRDILQEGAYE